MTKTKNDGTSFTGSLASGEELTLSVETTRAEDVMLLVDGGSSGTSSQEYTLTQELFSSELNEFQFYDTVQSTTSRSFIDPAFGSKMRVTIENVSPSQGTYRVTLISYT